MPWPDGAHGDSPIVRNVPSTFWHFFQLGEELLY